MRRVVMVATVLAAILSLASVAAASVPGQWVDGGRQVHTMEIPGQWVD